MGLLQPHGRYRRGHGQAAVSEQGSAPQTGGKAAGPQAAARPDGAQAASMMSPEAASEAAGGSGFRTLDDVDVAGKRVLLRVDLNVPMANGEILDRTRITRMLPTVLEI